MNLADNALRYNVQPGTIEISTGTPDGDAVLRIENTGPRVNYENVERMFQPFQRLGNARDGALGLGLSIVQAIATAHGGEVEARRAGRAGRASRCGYLSRVRWRGVKGVAFAKFIASRPELLHIRTRAESPSHRLLVCGSVPATSALPKA